MNASLQKKGRIYYAVVSLSNGAGRFKTKWISTKCSKKSDATKVMREILDKLESGQAVGKSNYSFLEFMQYWLDEIIKPQIEQTTYEGYMQNLKNHIKPFFAELNLNLTDVQLIHLQQFVNDRHKNGRLAGNGGLSGKSIKKFMANISKALDYAVKTGLIRQNPARYVDFPKDKPFVGAFYSMAEIDQLLKACKGTPLETPIILATHYGLRRGEILGLRWENIDFNAGTVAIRHTVSKCTSTVAKDKTKNASSRRVYPMLPEIREILLEAKEKGTTNKALFGKEYNANDYVFKWDDGRPFAPDFVTQKFSKLLQKHGLPHIRFHDLRHPYVKHGQTIFINISIHSCFKCN